MSREIEENLAVCDEILERYKKLGKSSKDRPDIWLLIDELKTKTKWLKELYKQIID